MGGLLALSRGIDRMTSLIGRSASWLILIAIFVSAGNAIIRKAFDNSSNAWLELQWYLYGGAFLLAAAYTLLENEHIRIDILYGGYSRRTQNRIDLFCHIFFLMPLLILTLYLALPWLIRSYQLHEGSNNAGGLLRWPAKALLYAGFLLLFLQGISEIIKKIAILRGMIEDEHAHKGTHAPIAVDPRLLEQAAMITGEKNLSERIETSGEEKRK